jgi:hypothetical protein
LAILAPNSIAQQSLYNEMQKHERQNSLIKLKYFVKTLSQGKPQKLRYHEKKESLFSKGLKEGYSKGYYKGLRHFGIIMLLVIFYHLVVTNHDHWN